MSLVWKLLRRHLSVGQLAGFFLANLFGMFIVLLGVQFYQDARPALLAGDSFMKNGYVTVSKNAAVGTSAGAASNTFSTEEIDDLNSQTFVEKTGDFIGAQYKAQAQMGINGKSIINTELPLESVPDDFLEVDADEWSYTPGAKEVPIILPRTYINMYNFGFARSHNLPRINEGLLGMIDLNLFIKGDTYKGHVVALSNHMNSILVPRSFIQWSNAKYAPDEPARPIRLLASLSNPTDQSVVKYMERNGYEVENDKLQSERAAHFLRLMVTLVMAVGLIISLLSFFILMLSIYLLVQKNAEKLENLLLIGYSPAAVARPYQLLAAGLNFLVLVMALGVLYLLRRYYLSILDMLFPRLDVQTMLPALAAGLGIFLLVTVVNTLIIRRKVAGIWRRKE